MPPPPPRRHRPRRRRPRRRPRCRLRRRHRVTAAHAAGAAAAAPCLRRRAASAVAAAVAIAGTAGERCGPPSRLRVLTSISEPLFSLRIYAPSERPEFAPDIYSVFVVGPDGKGVFVATVAAVGSITRVVAPVTCGGEYWVRAAA